MNRICAQVLERNILSILFILSGFPSTWANNTTAVLVRGEPASSGLKALLQTTFFNGRQQLKALSVLCRNGDSPKVRRRFGLGVLAVSGKAPAAGSAHRLLRTGG